MLGLFLSTTRSSLSNQPPTAVTAPTNSPTVTSFSRAVCEQATWAFASSSNLFGCRMVRIFAGYTIEQDELVNFLRAQGCLEAGVEPLTAGDTWLDLVYWRASKLRDGDSVPWVQFA